MRDHVVQVAFIQVSTLMFTSAVFLSFWIYFLIVYEAISVIQMVGYYILLGVCGINLFIIGPITLHILRVEAGDPWCLRLILTTYGALFLVSSLPTPFLSNIMATGEMTKQYIQEFYQLNARPPYLMDYIHRSRHCCGYSNYTDYYKGKVIELDDDIQTKEPLPRSCCSQMSVGCETSPTLIYKVGCFPSTTAKGSPPSVWEHPYHGTGFSPVMLLPLVLTLVHVLFMCHLHDAFALIIEKQSAAKCQGEVCKTESGQTVGSFGSSSDSESSRSGKSLASSVDDLSVDSEGAKAFKEQVVLKKKDKKKPEDKKKLDNEKVPEDKPKKKGNFFQNKFKNFFKEHTHTVPPKEESNLLEQLHHKKSEEEKKSVHSEGHKEQTHNAPREKEPPHHIQANPGKFLVMHSPHEGEEEHQHEKYEAAKKAQVLDTHHAHEHNRVEELERNLKNAMQSLEEQIVSKVVPHDTTEHSHHEHKHPEGHHEHKHHEGHGHHGGMHHEHKHHEGHHTDHHGGMHEHKHHEGHHTDHHGGMHEHKHHEGHHTDHHGGMHHEHKHHEGHHTGHYGHGHHHTGHHGEPHHFEGHHHPGHHGEAHHHKAGHHGEHHEHHHQTEGHHYGGHHGETHHHHTGHHHHHEGNHGHGGHHHHHEPEHHRKHHHHH